MITPGSPGRPLLRENKKAGPRVQPRIWLFEVNRGGVAVCWRGVAAGQELACRCMGVPAAFRSWFFPRSMISGEPDEEEPAGDRLELAQISRRCHLGGAAGTRTSFWRDRDVMQGSAQ